MTKQLRTQGFLFGAVLRIGVACGAFAAVFVQRQPLRPLESSVGIVDRISLCRQLHAFCGDADTVRKAVLL